MAPETLHLEECTEDYIWRTVTRAQYSCNRDSDGNCDVYEYSRIGNDTFILYVNIKGEITIHSNESGYILYDIKTVVSNLRETMQSGITVLYL